MSKKVELNLHERKDFLSIRNGLVEGNQVWYQIMNLAGRGGNAETYYAMCTEPKSEKGKFFAIKFFTNIDTPGRIEAFLQEYQFLRGFNHQYIMEVFHLNYYEDAARHPFFVAEFLPETFRYVMDLEPSTTRKAIYAIQLLSALKYIHSRIPSIIHRDIKPTNIFRKGSDCVLGDFGLAKQLWSLNLGKDERAEDVKRLKQSHGTGMSRDYRTPDHIRYYRNEAMITSAADIYQLGLVLTEAFTGVNPMPPPPDGDLTVIVDCEEIPYVDDPNGGLIKEVLRDMLKPKPEDRQTASDLIDRWDTVMRKSMTEPKGS